jgi:hypothetical protein
MSEWGSSNEQKPKFPWLVSGGGNTVNNLANTYATEKGWTFKWPWGEEVLVGIGGLATLMGAPTCAVVEAVTTTIRDLTPANVAFRLVYNEGVVVTGTPSIVAIGANGAANVVLTYAAAQSDPSAGRLVFANTTIGLGGLGNGTLTVNSTSGGANYTNYANITDATNTSVTITNTIVGANTVVITQAGSASKSPSASLSPSSSLSPSASVSPSKSPSASLSPSASKSPSASVSPSA